MKTDTNDPGNKENKRKMYITGYAYNFLKYPDIDKSIYISILLFSAEKC